MRFDIMRLLYILLKVPCSMNLLNNVGGLPFHSKGWLESRVTVPPYIDIYKNQLH